MPSSDKKPLAEATLWLHITSPLPICLFKAHSFLPKCTPGQVQWTEDSQRHLLSIRLSKESLLLNSPAGRPTVHIYLLSALEIKASPFTLRAHYIGTICPPDNNNIGSKVPVVKQGFCVHIINNNRKLSPVKKLHNLSNPSACLFFFQHPTINTGKLILSKLYKKASKFKKIQHSYLYINFSLICWKICLLLYLYVKSLCHFKCAWLKILLRNE